jgi:hypothetical protein
MDEGTKKSQNFKCRLHWCLIECIDWRYRQPVSHVGIFDPSCELLPRVAVCGGGGGVELCCRPYSAGI